MKKQNSISILIGLISLMIFLGFKNSKIDNPILNNESQSPKLLENIQYRDTLLLSQRDDKCGEWGGNFKWIIIYRNKEDKKLYADYFFQKVSCGNPYEKSSEQNTTKNTGCELLYDELQMIIKAIAELTEIQLNRPNIVGMSGIENSVSLNHGISELKIRDYPSKNWKNFNLLCERIKKKNCD